MCDSFGIAISKANITDRLIDHIILLDGVGKISLDAIPDRLTHETWVEAFERQNLFSQEHFSSTAMYSCSFPFKQIDGTDHVYFSGESGLDTDEFAKEFAPFGKEVRIWFESCDGFNPSELTIFEDGTHLLYDVDQDDSIPFIKADIIHLIRNYPSPAFKTVVLDLLQETRFNDKSTVYKPLPDVIPKHLIADVLGKLDDGNIEMGEALELIKDIEKPATNQYMVFINSEYCDAQAYIDNPNGEFGGDGYVELSSTYPICIGTYRGKSPEQAIEHAASNMDASEEIFYAVQVQK